MPQPVDIKVGETIRQLRIDRKLSQSDLASSLGVSYEQIQKYEAGKKRVTTSQLVRIAHILRADVSVFFAGNQPLPIDPTNDNFVPELLMTRQGLELLKAFHAIQNSCVRARLLFLVKSVAKDESALGSFESLEDDGVVL